MAISHIPRSVGHNFAPEYQISAIPYCFYLAADNEGMDKVVVHKASGVIAATPDPDNANEYLVVAGTGFEANDLKDDNNDPITLNNLHADFALIHRLKLPKIAQWIQVKNIGNDAIYKIQGGRADLSPKDGNNDHVDEINGTVDLRIWFNPKGAANNSTEGQFRVHGQEITDVLNFRFSTLYFQLNQFGNSVNMRIGLTTIDADQFDNVVETFLNDKF